MPKERFGKDEADATIGEKRSAVGIYSALGNGSLIMLRCTRGYTRGCVSGGIFR